MHAQHPDAVKNLMAQAYGRTAVSFAAHADRLVYSFLARPLAQAVAELLTRGRGARPVLDVAAGSGALSRLLPNVVAVDLVPAQLRSNSVGRRVCADAEALPFAADTFGVAASAFGVNHFPAPEAAIAEFARVAPAVAVLTWARPDTPYEPRDAIAGVIERHAGFARTPTEVIIDEYSERVGSPEALRELFAGAGLKVESHRLRVPVKWTGAEDYVAYRLGVSGAAEHLADRGAVHAEAVAVVEALPRRALVWKPSVVLAVGMRD